MKGKEILVFIMLLLKCAGMQITLEFLPRMAPLLTTERLLVNWQLIFFKDLLRKFSAVPERNYFEDIQPVLSRDDNEMLSKMPDGDEIWQAISNLPKGTASGADGFTGDFFYSCWNIISEDIIEAVQALFKGI